MAVVRRCRKELRAAPREPIDRKPDPFAHGGVASSQPIAHARKRAQRIFGSARAPVDRVGFDRKARLAEDADRPRKVMGRRDQQPTFARLGLGDGLGKNRVLDRIARAILERDARARDAEAFQQAQRPSSGMISALPAGERPRIASTMRLAKASTRPARAKRVASSNSPRTPIDTTRLDGMAKKPRILERGKNIHQSLLLPRLVARPGVGVHGIKAGKLRPALDLADDEAFHALV